MGRETSKAQRQVGPFGLERWSDGFRKVCPSSTRVGRRFVLTRLDQVLLSSDRPKVIPDRLGQLSFLIAEMGTHNLFQFSVRFRRLREICF